MAAAPRRRGPGGQPSIPETVPEREAPTAPARSAQEHPRLLDGRHELRRLHHRRRRCDQPRCRGPARRHRAGDAQGAPAPSGAAVEAGAEFMQSFRDAWTASSTTPTSSCSRARSPTSASRRAPVATGRRWARKWCGDARPSDAASSGSRPPSGCSAWRPGRGGDHRHRHLRHLGRRPGGRGQPHRRDERDGLPRQGLSERVRPAGRSTSPAARRWATTSPRPSSPSCSSCRASARCPPSTSSAARRGCSAKPCTAAARAPATTKKASSPNEYGGTECLVEIGCWGPVVQLQHRQARRDQPHGRLHERRRRLHRLHHARLPRQVLAVLQGAAGRRRLDGDVAQRGRRDPPAAAVEQPARESRAPLGREQARAERMGHTSGPALGLTVMEFFYQKWQHWGARKPGRRAGRGRALLGRHRPGKPSDYHDESDGGRGDNDRRGPLGGLAAVDGRGDGGDPHRGVAAHHHLAHGARHPRRGRARAARRRAHSRTDDAHLGARRTTNEVAGEHPRDGAADRAEGRRRSPPPSNPTPARADRPEATASAIFNVWAAVPRRLRRGAASSWRSCSRSSSGPRATFAPASR